MSGKSLVIIGALTLSSLGIASAKTYDIVLNAPAKAGDTELKPGAYKVKIEGYQATFIDVQDNKSVNVPVHVENGDKKFPYTTVETANQNGMDKIQAIDLGGSTTQVKLGE